MIASAEDPAFSIRGTVVDSLSGKGVELATIALSIPGNDQIVTGTTSDADGKFIIQNVKPGKYQLAILFIGYSTKNISIEVNRDLQLGVIQFSSSSKTLDAAVVTAEKSLITKNSEKTVFNVAQSPANQIGNAEDVLRNMPGVSVDQKGNISIIGKQGVKILVDGKPNAQAQNDLDGFLKSIPASSIEAIELITNPSARYDAEGNAGIINIKLKKGKADGLNGTISAGYGILNRYNGNAEINYRKNKFNIFATYAGDFSKTGDQWIEHRAINLNDTITHYNMNSVITDQHLNNSLKAGIDYFINDKNTLTYTTSSNYSVSKWLSVTSSQDMDAFENELEQYNSTDNELNKNFSINNDIAYRKKFDSTDRELDIDINHTYVGSGQNGNISSLAYDTAGNFIADNSLYRRTSTTNRIHNFIFQLDYIHPLKKLKGYKIELGAKNETTMNKNVFNAYDINNNVASYDSLISNNFNYTENISAAYFIMSGAYKKWLSYSAGLRGEYTYIRSNDNSVNKNYFSPFPSASINVAINDTQNLSFNYSRRVQRPQFRQINNTISYIDQYSTWQGNPYLQPTFSNIVSANYTINVGKDMFSFEASGNFQNNIIIESSRIDSMRISRGGVMNGGNASIFNLTFFFKLQLTKWWDLQMSHSYAYSAYGFTSGVNLAPISGSSYNLWGETSFKVWKNMVFDVGGWLNTKGVNPQGVILPIGGLHASVKKSFLNDHITVSLAAYNILNTIKWQWTVNTVGLTTAGSWQQFDRVLMITLTYKFGSNKNAFERKAREENNRLSGGGGGRG
jgi:iron complex outermembrane receptor protein